MNNKLIKMTSMLILSGVLLCSCAGKSSNAAASDIISAAKTSGSTFEELESVEKADIKYYYNLDESSYSDFSAMVSGNQAYADEIVVVKAASSSKVSDIKKALEERIDSRKKTLESYAPDEYQKLCDASVKTDGDYVYLVVGDDTKDALKAIKDLC
ncbi:MAG: DUF4358 domain-containing protein [Oscillospiraceae bacterium]|nr:DUF4358 domain-containing protein [Oscillospiraceae bacterium]